MKYLIKLFTRIKIYFWNKKLDRLEARISKVDNMAKDIPNITASILSKRERSNKRRKNKMKNKKCVCGSGKKFKKCCWHKLGREKRISDLVDLDKMK